MYLDLCGETPIPTDEGGGGQMGRRGDWDWIENRKISCLCRESKSDGHVFPSAWQSMNACTGWFPVHTYVGISNNAVTKCRRAWHISEFLASHRRKPPAPHSPVSVFASEYRSVKNSCLP